MTLRPARVPYVRLQQPNDGLDRELQKIERAGAGLYVPRLITVAQSPYTVQATDWSLAVDATAGNVTVVFPSAAQLDGLSVRVVKTDSTAHTVTLQTTVSGVVNPVLRWPFAEMTVDAMAGIYVSTTAASDIIRGTQPVAIATPTTLFTAAAFGLYVVGASILSGSASAYAMAYYNGVTFSLLTTTSASAAFSLSVSGMALQATQGIGGTQDVLFSATVQR